MHTTFYSQRLNRRDRLGDLDIDWMIILECMGTATEQEFNDGFFNDADDYSTFYFFPYGSTAPVWVLAYLHETLRFTSVY
jgi:hypothetical protein